jgi:hypothetical protein
MVMAGPVPGWFRYTPTGRIARVRSEDLRGRSRGSVRSPSPARRFSRPKAHAMKILDSFLARYGRLWSAVFALHLLAAGLMPLVALVIEHGRRAGLFLSTHPHYFFFQLFVCPLAVLRLGTPLRYLWRNVITRRGKVVFILLPFVLSAFGCAYDFYAGAPALFEFVRSVQDDPAYEVAPGTTLWQFFENAETMSPGNSALATKYSKRMQQLVHQGMRSWIVVPYYVGLFAQIVFGVLLVLVIGAALSHRSEFLKVKDASSELIFACWFCFSWLPLQISFISIKRTLYGAEGATAVIALFGLIVLFFMLVVSTFLVRELDEKIFSLSISMIATGLAVFSPIYSVGTGISPLFSKRWPVEWYFMIYGFTWLFFLPSLLGITKEVVDVDEGIQGPERARSRRSR